MTMGVKVYYSEISGNKEVKKRQQRVMMILDSKQIPYEAIDITEAGKESEKEFMMKNAKPKGDSKTVQSPQIFNDELYCGDYDDFDLANENDVLENLLHTPKVERQFSYNGAQNGAAGSREGSAEAQVKSTDSANVDDKVEAARSELEAEIGEHTADEASLVADAEIGASITVEPAANPGLPPAPYQPAADEVVVEESVGPNGEVAHSSVVVEPEEMQEK